MESRDEITLPQIQWDDREKSCHFEQTAVIECMQAMNKGENGNEKFNRSNECYLPSVTAWNECVVKKVGYL